MPTGADKDASSPDLPSPKLLLVSQDEKACEDVCHHLANKGWQTQCLMDPTRLQSVLRETETSVDLVLLDLDFPDHDVSGALEEIMNTPEPPGIIVSSGEKSEETAMHCLGKGAVDFVNKPWHAKEMGAALQRALRRRRVTRVDHGDLHAEHPTTGWVELTAPSDLEFLARIQRFSEVLFSTRLPFGVAEDLRMAMEEMGRNAIEWGNRFDREKQFNIAYCFFKDRVVLKFEDEGEGFEPGALPDPSVDPEEHLATREKNGKRPGGFGIFLMNSIMDEIVYSERGNICLMTKFLNKEEGAEDR